MAIPPINIRDYARAKGWALVPEALNDRLYVFENPRFDPRQLVIPMDTTVPDYEDTVLLAARKLSQLEGRPVARILSEFSEVRDDILRLRITGDRDGMESLPLAFATTAIVATQQLLKSAAHTVLRPQIHHPRLNRAEAQRFVDVAQFQHTEHSSFVLKVSCAIDAIDVQVGNEPEPPTFVRQTMLVVNYGIRQLVTAIEADQLDNFVEGARLQEAPIVSSNFCEALSSFRDDRLRNSLEVSMSWAAAVRPIFEGAAQPIRLQPNYFSRIEEVGHALRNTARQVEDRFIGTVEQLNGDVGDDGRRAGEIILALLLPDSESLVRARTNLNADQYEAADYAHMHDGVFVVITGRLHPGNQPRQLTNVTGFDLIGGAPQNQIEE